MLKIAPELRVLATSREPLYIDGEVTFRVPSLSVPPADPITDINVMLGYSAIRLFMDRAVSALPEFRVDHGNVDALVGICRKLDGIPLAIEMAAAQVRAMTTAQIYCRLNRQLLTLSGGGRT